MTYELILERMLERYRELAGFTPDDASDIGIRLQVLAGQLELAYRDLDRLELEMFPQTSSGQYLELHAAQRGLARKKAVAARGTLRFSRASAAQYDIIIPAGTICATAQDDPIQVQTLEDGLLTAGDLWVEIPAVSLAQGGAGNLAAGKISVMVTPAQGIGSVEQPEAFAGGIDAEGDEELRQRLLTAYRMISNGTNSAFYYDLAMKHEGVASAAVLPRERGRGTVDVVVASDAYDLQEMVDTLTEELARAKEINVDVLVRAAEEVSADIRVEIDPEEGADIDEVRGNVEREIRGYLGRLAVGEMLRMAQLSSGIFAVEGVFNLRFLQPSGDIRVRGDQIIRPGAVTVERMAVT